MKKILSLMAAALLSVGAYAQVASNAVGLYRTMTQSEGDWIASEQKIATTDGVTVTPTYGATTQSTDLDNDEVYGTSTETPRYLGAALPADGLTGGGRIFPATELSAKDEGSYIGFKMTIPEGKTCNIDKLVAYGLFGNAFYWCADVLQNGNILYTTDQLKVNNYNKDYAWGTNVIVTADKLTGEFNDACNTQFNKYVENGWTSGIAAIDEYVYSTNGCKAWGNVLTDAVKNLSGDVEVRLYYWGKSKKALALKDLYVVLSSGTSGIQNITAPVAKAQSSAMYNLAGQRVDKSYKGIVIQNGKKFMNK